MVIIAARIKTDAILRVMIAVNMIARQVVITPVMVIPTTTRPPTHFISLTSPIFVSAQQTLLFVLLTRCNLGQIFTLSVDNILSARIHCSHIIMSGSALTLN